MSESQNIEWKESWRDEHLKGICAFANTKGGIFVIGKKDDGEIVGVKNAKKLMEDLPNKISNLLSIVCEVNLLKEGDLEYIEIIVEPVKQAVSFQGRHFVRSGSTTRMLSGSSLVEFIMEKNDIQWDALIEKGATIDDIDSNAIGVYKQVAIEGGRLPYLTTQTTTEKLLKSLELMNNEGGITKAALLLFGKHPLRINRTAYLKIGKFGDSSSELLVQDVVETNSFEMAQKTLELIDAKYVPSHISYKGLQRIETPEYPYNALREMLLNAIMHRRYGDAAITVRIYEDRIKIWNTGKLSDKLTFEKLKDGEHHSHPRNKLLANAFYKANMVESWGRGITIIMEECERYGLPEPRIEEQDSGVAVTLFKDIYNKKYLSKIDITDRQREIIQYVKDNDFATNSIISDNFSIVSRTALRDLKELVDLKILKKEGEGSATKYIIDVMGYKNR